MLRFSDSEAFEAARLLMELVVSVMAFVMEFSCWPTLGMAAVFSMMEEDGVRVARVESVTLLVYYGTLLVGWG